MARKFLMIILLCILAFYVEAKNNDFIIPEKIGIRKSSLRIEEVIPPAILESESAEESMYGKYKKAYSTAPPPIPHSVKDYMPITQKKNACIECHEIDKAKLFNIKSMPYSHYVNARTGQKLPFFYNGIYNCSLCHVPQLNIQLPVQNIFSK
ncbi:MULTISPECIES: nitrate reductase cytochrome c-type subunit [Thermodesulfovibrio]|uniref:nitrate reductase cytochrome c-type subunit n=1 Tax=Thermodesulfovibrio TaxID=28261 RepID=UPI0003F5610C|nr:MULTISPECIES: nitrate reductase cytochrome c-type subunit [Thermodesulfovibrio]MDI6865211.1 nitrate reductase cytochrome c-type subunit [Thermodesulfovibrio yellowstonii]